MYILWPIFNLLITVEFYLSYFRKIFRKIKVDSVFVPYFALIDCKILPKAGEKLNRCCSFILIRILKYPVNHVLCICLFFTIKWLKVKMIFFNSICHPVNNVFCITKFTVNITWFLKSTKVIIREGTETAYFTTAYQAKEKKYSQFYWMYEYKNNFELFVNYLLQISRYRLNRWDYRFLWVVDYRSFYFKRSVGHVHTVYFSEGRTCHHVKFFFFYHINQILFILIKCFLEYTNTKIEYRYISWNFIKSLIPKSQMSKRN